MARKIIPRASSEQTREKILAVAESLFSASGYDGVSLRQIGTEAEVPFALVTYHFQTKLGLYQAVFRKRITEFQVRRQDLLKSVEIQPDIYKTFLEIAAAFVGPMMKLRQMPRGEQFAQLLAREIFDPNEAERGVVAEHLDPLAHLTMELLQEVVPGASKAEIARAYHFATGALAVNHAGSGRLKRISGLNQKALTSGDPTGQLVHFIAAGLVASLCPAALDEVSHPGVAASHSV
jgi:AcrR family transcriptional regulator